MPGNRSALRAELLKGAPSAAKAGTMLRHGAVRGKPLTKKQKGFFGALRGGAARKP